MVSKKIFKKILLFLIGKNRHGIGKKCGYFQLGMGPKSGSEIKPAFTLNAGENYKMRGQNICTSKFLRVQKY